jgi:hypothetical protein
VKRARASDYYYLELPQVAHEYGITDLPVVRDDGAGTRPRGWERAVASVGNVYREGQPFHVRDLEVKLQPLTQFQPPTANRHATVNRHPSPAQPSTVNHQPPTVTPHNSQSDTSLERSVSISQACSLVRLYSGGRIGDSRGIFQGTCVTHPLLVAFLVGPDCKRPAPWGKLAEGCHAPAI